MKVYLNNKLVGDQENFKMNWDLLISGTILLWLGLVIWAKVSKRTIRELIAEIRAIILDTREDFVESRGDLIYND